MGASRGGLATLSGNRDQELTTQEKARREWINEQRGIDSSDQKAPQRMAGQRGGPFGIMGLMSRGMLGSRSRPYRRSKETRDWIDQQRGVEYDKRDDKKASLRDLFGIRSIQDRQRYQDRNAWIDEQIRKQREATEAQKISAANQPMTEDERRGYLNTEVESRKDMWD